MVKPNLAPFSAGRLSNVQMIGKLTVSISRIVSHFLTNDFIYVLLPIESIVAKHNSIPLRHYEERYFSRQVFSQKLTTGDKEETILPRIEGTLRGASYFLYYHAGPPGSVSGILYSKQILREINCGAAPDRFGRNALDWARLVPTL